MFEPLTQESAVPQPHRRFRDVVTGLFTSKKKAAASPATTVAESYGPTFSDRLFADKVNALARWHAEQAERCVQTVDGNVAMYEFHWQAAKDLNNAAEHMMRSR